MQRGHSSKKKVVIFLVILLALVLGYFLVHEAMKKSICVSRAVSGDSDRTVKLDVEVSLFKGPKSFIIEERIPPGAILMYSQPKELFNQDGRLSWMFWNGGLKPKNTQISYVLSNFTGENVYGRLFLAVDKNNPDKGYSDLIIGSGRICI